MVRIPEHEENLTINEYSEFHAELLEFLRKQVTCGAVVSFDDDTARACQLALTCLWTGARQAGFTPSNQKIKNLLDRPAGMLDAVKILREYAIAE